MSSWSDQDEAGEGEAMREYDRLAALGLVIMLAFAFIVLCIEILDITIPLP